MTIGTNDYPWAGGVCFANNPANCDYDIRNCTDFCQWRIRHDLGLGCFSLGSALSWATKAAALGIRVDHSPALGSIMQLDPGVQGASSAGHVAFVLGVGPGTFYGLTANAGQVVCEQYNWAPCAYSKRVFAVAGANFIHFRDLASGCSPAICGAPCSCSGNTCVCPPPPMSASTWASIFVWGGAGALLFAATRPHIRTELARREQAAERALHTGGPGGFQVRTRRPVNPFARPPQRSGRSGYS